MAEMQIVEDGAVLRAIDDEENSQIHEENPADSSSPSASKPLSKRAQKKLLKQQNYEAKKAQKKALVKEQKMLDKERRRKEWDGQLATLSEEEKLKLIEARKSVRKERMEKRSEERERKIERLTKAKQFGQNIVIDLEFSHLMTPNEISSLVQQIMYCYAVNGRCDSPSHLWLTGCNEDMETQLNRLPGYDRWIIEKEARSYIEALGSQREDLVYLTADAEKALDDLEPNKVYIIGGLVDRNRWKGITMKKAMDQGIQSARLPIGDCLKMSSSQVLTVNQVVEILLRYLETRDWKSSFFQVIPQRKRSEADGNENGRREEEENEEKDDLLECPKKIKISDAVEANGKRKADLVESLV